MKHIFTNYKLQMVKEHSQKYEINNQISNPDSIIPILKIVMEADKESEEVLYLLCLNTQNKINAIFEVSRGALDYGIVHPREIAKRIILSNACKFMLAHNHPSMDTTPSPADIEVASKMNEIGLFFNIPMIDFLIVGNDIFSFKKQCLI